MSIINDIIPDTDNVKISRSNLRHVYLPKALDRIVQCIDSENERIALEASKYIVDRVLGKPKEELDPSSDRALATTLAQALRLALEQSRGEQSALPPPMIDGAVRILGIEKPIEEVQFEDFPDA